jgi:hypothetical protein
MMKIWNPIEAYRKASQRSQEAQTRHEANTKICIGDYTDSKGATYTALIIDGIPVQRVTADNIQSCEEQLCSVRQEYIDKRADTAAV